MLRRQIAPASRAALDAIDDEVRIALHTLLGGRQVVDINGPTGLGQGALNVGTLEVFDTGIDGVTAGMRKVQPLVELRVPFTIDQMTIDTIDRGAKPDLGQASDAARRIALAEDRAIFHGWPQAGIKGIMESVVHEGIGLPDDLEQLPKTVAEAVATLRTEGVEGAYSLVLGTQAFRAAGSANVDGYPVRKFIEPQLEGGAIVHAPAVEGGVLLSRRGGDFELTVGQDMAVGYFAHDRDEVEFYITESFTFRVLDGGAAVVLEQGTARTRPKQDQQVRANR